MHLPQNMEVRFPTYSLRELQRPRGQSADADDSFIQVIGQLDADTQQDLSRGSRQAGLADPDDSATGEHHAAPVPMGADVIAAVLRQTSDRAPAELAPADPGIGEMLDLKA